MNRPHTLKDVANNLDKWFETLKTSDNDYDSDDRPLNQINSPNYDSTTGSSSSSSSTQKRKRKLIKKSNRRLTRKTSKNQNFGPKRNLYNKEQMGVTRTEMSKFMSEVMAQATVTPEQIKSLLETQFGQLTQNLKSDISRGYST